MSYDPHDTIAAVATAPGRAARGVVRISGPRAVEVAAVTIILAAGLGRLNVCVSGGGSLPRTLDEYFLAIGIPLVNGYGLTETSPVVSMA